MKALTGYHVASSRSTPNYESVAGHDDIVIALAMAVWFCERTYAPGMPSEGIVEPDREPYDPLYGDD